MLYINKISFLLVLIFCLIGVNACSLIKSSEPNKSQSEQLQTFVSILPQKFFVEQIGKDKINVNVMVMPGESPAIYEPKPHQMRQLGKCSSYFSIGVPFEAFWLRKFKKINPNINIIKTQNGIKKVEMENLNFFSAYFKNHKEMNVNHHDHDANSHLGSHSHEGIKDPHIWLAPSLVKVQSKNILNALIAQNPENKKYYTKNYQELIDRIDFVDKAIKQNLGNSKEKKILLTFHPAWGYFAREYNLQQVSIEIEGKSPKLEYIKKIIDFAKTKNIKTIYVQPQFSKKLAQQIATDINGKVVTIDPLAYNWDENLINVSKTLGKL